MDLPIIILVAISLTFEIILLILLLVFRAKGAKSNQEVDISAISRIVGGLSSDIEHLKTDMDQQFKLVIKNEMVAISDQNNEKLERFQRNITESLEKKLSELTTKVEEALANINKRAEDQMITVGKQTFSASEQNNEKLERFQKSITESLEKKLTELTAKVDDALANINKRVDEQIKTGFNTTVEQMGKVEKGLGQLQEAQKQIESLKGEVTNLSGILSNNQQRGKFGEFQLAAILHNVFGDTQELYSLQHEIKQPKTGTKVRPDAVVFLPEPNKLVCIDSKFPFQEYAKIFSREDESKEIKTAFKNAVRGHIKTIRDKYIIEGETARQAIMFIPSDGVYAYINIDFPELVDEAMKDNIVLTSPTTLQPMLASIYGLIIEYKKAKNLEELNKTLINLAKDFKKFIDNWDKILKNIQTAYTASNAFDERVRLINDRFVKIKQVQVATDEPDSTEE